MFDYYQERVTIFRNGKKRKRIRKNIKSSFFSINDIKIWKTNMWTQERS